MGTLSSVPISQSYTRDCTPLLSQWRRLLAEHAVILPQTISHQFLERSFFERHVGCTEQWNHYESSRSDFMSGAAFSCVPPFRLKPIHGVRSVVGVFIFGSSFALPAILTRRPFLGNYCWWWLHDVLCNSSLLLVDCWLVSYYPVWLYLYCFLLAESILIVAELFLLMDELYTITTITSVMCHLYLYSWSATVAWYPVNVVWVQSVIVWLVLAINIDYHSLPTLTVEFCDTANLSYYLSYGSWSCW